MFLLLDEEMRKELQDAYDAGVTSAIYGDGFSVGSREKYVEPALERMKNTSVTIDVKVPNARKKKT